MGFFDKMYEAGYDDPDDYLDSLDTDYDDYNDYDYDSYSCAKQKVPDKDVSAKRPCYRDYLASVFLKKECHITNLIFTPKVTSLPDGHNCVVINISGTIEGTGERVSYDCWPYYEVGSTDIDNLPKHVNDIVLRFIFQERDVIEEEGNNQDPYVTLTWLSYTKGKANVDCTFSGERCKIDYHLSDADYHYSNDQRYLLSRIDTSVTEGDKRDSWTDEYGCTYNKSGTKLLYCDETTKQCIIRTGTLCICDNAFSRCDIDNIVIPQTVVEIGNYAFGYCNKLKEIKVPNSILKLGRNTFENCVHLEVVIFDDVAETEIKRIDIPKECFNYCFNLRIAHLPNYVKSIGSFSFRNCEKLEEIILPNSITKIGCLAFSQCKSLKEITIPILKENNKVNCFEECTSLKKIIVTSGFDMNSINIPEGVEIIENNKSNG